MKFQTGQEVYHKNTLKTGVVLKHTTRYKGNTILCALNKVTEAGHITKVRWDHGEIGHVNTEDLEALNLQLIEINEEH